MEWIDFHEGEHGVASLTFHEEDDVFRVLVTSDGGARLFAAARQSGSMRLPDCLCVDDGGCLLELGDSAMAQGENLELRWTCPRCLAEWHYTATPTGLTAERL